MNVILFGATGMVGQGVLRECLLDAEVERVLVVGRVTTGVTHAKLRELLRADLADLGPVAAELRGYDACFFCLGVSSVGLDEAAYKKITYDLTLAAARVLLAENPGLRFVYVSGQGTDSSKQGRSMWARVKGKTENDLLALPFGAAYMFRPGAIQPTHGERTKVRAYQVALVVLKPLFPLLRWLFPNHVTTTDRLGRAMLHVVKHGSPLRHLAPRDINAASA